MSSSLHPAAWRRALTRVADGPYRWGRLTVSPSRYGVTHYALRLYPPGLDRSGRIRLRVADLWPVIGLVLWLSVVLFDPFGGSAVGTMAVASLVCLCAWFVLWRFTRRIRSGVVVLHGVRGLDRSAAGRLRDIEVSFSRLVTADCALMNGAITAVEHELVWASVYEAAAVGGRKRSQWV